MATPTPKPCPPFARSPRDVEGAIERAISDVPPPQTHQVADPDRQAEVDRQDGREARGAPVRIAGAAARAVRHADGAAGPLPHLEDAAADGRRHLRAVRPHGGAHAHAHAVLPLPPRGEPGAARRRRAHRPARRRAAIVERRLAERSCTRSASSVSKRVAGNAASRWVPVVGAAAVGAYAYWDTLQVATDRAPVARRSCARRAERSRDQSCRLFASHVRTLRTAHASGGDSRWRSACRFRPRSVRATTSRRCRTCRSSASRSPANASSRRCAGASCRAGRRTRPSATR